MVVESRKPTDVLDPLTVKHQMATWSPEQIGEFFKKATDAGLIGKPEPKPKTPFTVPKPPPPPAK